MDLDHVSLPRGHKKTKAVLFSTDQEDCKIDQCRQLPQEFENTFCDRPGSTTFVKCELQLISQDSLFALQYPFLFGMEVWIEKMLKDILARGLVEIRRRPCKSPVVLLKKTDQAFSLRIDFRRLNEVVVPHAKRSPRTDTMLSEIVTRCLSRNMNL